MKVILHTDGGCRVNSKDKPEIAAAAFVARTEEGQYLASQAEVFVGTNNVAEYRGVVLAALAIRLLLRTFGNLQLDRFEFRSDSKLVVQQMNLRWQINDPEMFRLSKMSRRILETIEYPYHFLWIPRTQNTEVDYLCNLALDGTVKTDLFTAIPVRTVVASKTTCGQAFRQHGALTTPRRMCVDSDGYALCNGCKARLVDCTCPSLEGHDDGVQFRVAV